MIIYNTKIVSKEMSKEFLKYLMFDAISKCEKGKPIKLIIKQE